VNIRTQKYFDAKILIVDDNIDNVALLLVMLGRTGYTNIESTTDPRAVRDLYDQNRYDLILLDINMPELDGFQVMEQLADLNVDSYLPILVITAHTDIDIRIKALESGAMDFISKPFVIAEVQNRIANILEVRALYNERKLTAERLERKVEERTLKLHTANEALIVKVEERTRMLSQEITERRQTEQSLLEAFERAASAERYLMHAIDSISEGFAIFDGQDRLVRWNKHYESMWPEVKGLIKKGVTFPELLDGFIESGIVDHTVGGREVWRDNRLTSFYECQELEAYLHDGRVLLCRDHKMPDGGRVGIRTDITKLKKHETALMESEARFRAISETSPVAIIIARTDDSVILYSNPQAGALLGIPHRELIGSQTLDIYANPADREEIKNTLKRDGHVRNHEILIKTFDNKQKWVMASLEMITFDGERAMMSGVIDITEMHESRDKLVQSAKMATLGEMASGIAHEINQPLGIIKMAAETMLLGIESGKYGTDKIEKKLSTVVDQSDRMADIINHMRSFSRKDHSVFTRFNPAGTIDSAVQLMTGQLETSGIILDQKKPPTCPEILGSPLQLEQVMLNLLSNARDSVLDKMKKGSSGEAGFHPKVNVTLKTNPRRGCVVIYISDNGVGIPEDARGKIFEPFYTTKTSGSGTGLGLSISYNIITNMDGDIQCREWKGGTLFRISFPFASPVVDQTPPGEPKEPTELSDEAIITREKIKHVLVVDDEPLAVEGISDYLMQYGYEVVTASDGAAALKIITSHPVDVLITDLRMPVMDGNELIHKIRETNKSLPIIVTTGHTIMGDDKEVLTEGATVVLRKPIRLRDIKDFLGGKAL